MFDEESEAGFDVLDGEKERSLEALESELLCGWTVIPSNFDAEFGGSAGVAGDGDAGSGSFGGELGELFGSDAFKDKWCIERHGGLRKKDVR